MTKLHRILMIGLPVFFALVRIKGMDTHFGWPFEYGVNLCDVAGDEFPLLSGFRPFALCGNIFVGAVGGYVCAEIGHRLSDVFYRK